MKVFEKQSVARAALFKGLYTKIVKNNEILSLSCLFKTLGSANLRFIFKPRAELGFQSQKSLFSNIESIRPSFGGHKQEEFLYHQNWCIIKSSWRAVVYV